MSEQSPTSEAPRPGAEPPKKDLKKIYTLAVLHMAQYFPQGFTQNALPATFRQQGLPLDKFWMLSVPMWPRWIKFLVAMIVDNFGNEKFGYRKSWILPCTVISAILYIALAFVQPVVASVGLIVTILVVKGFFMTAQDVAVDAYCSESFTDAERPTGASILAFLSALGNFLGTGCVALVDSIGWSPTMLLASALLLVAATPALIRPEPPPPPALRARRRRGETATFWKSLRRKDSTLVMPHCFAAGWVDSFAFTMVAPFFIDHGMSLTAYGIFGPSVGILGRGTAAYVVPRIIERFGQRVSALIGAVGFLGEGAYYGTLAYRGELPSLWKLILVVAGLNFLYMHYVMSINTSRFPVGVEGTGRNRLLDPVELLLHRHKRRRRPLRLSGGCRRLHHVLHRRVRHRGKPRRLLRALTLEGRALGGRPRSHDGVVTRTDRRIAAGATDTRRGSR